MICWRRLLAISVLMILCATAVSAQSQRLPLRAGWNLISLAVVPQDAQPAAVFAPLIAANNFEALWAYDAAAGVWRSFPAAAPTKPTIGAVETGVGYWLRVQRATTLDINGVTEVFPVGPDEIAAEWNLVGFPVEEPTLYERVLTDPAIRQIWTFDASAGDFRGVVIDPQGMVTREDFREIEPGRGYWLFAAESTSIAPLLGTGLPPDVDFPPLVPNASTEVAVSFAPLTAGDIDIGRDGSYDRTASQRAIDFGEHQELQPISIFNEGAGVLSWLLAVDEPDRTPWLRLSVASPDGGAPVLRVEESGTVASETDLINLVVDRTGLAPGDYTARVILTSSGAVAAPPSEPVRSILVRVRVAGLEGDYRLRVEIDTVDGKPADLPNPRIVLSLYEDANGLKAIVSDDLTLLIPQRLRMFGAIYERDTSRFELSGSFAMPAGHPSNPFGTDVRRDVTIRGDRRDLSDPRDLLLGPLDLRGEYFETIRNVLEEPIYLSGTFIGERLSGTGTIRDRASPKNATSQDIPDTSVLEQTVNVTERLLISEVDVSVNLAHSRPSDLVVTLIGPDDTEAVLRSRSGAEVGLVVYDDFATPLDDLAIFDGKLAPGLWTLRVEDQAPGSTGTLLGWELDIVGTNVYDVAGNAGDEVPPGSTLVLTGCGATAVATTDASGNFRFRDLIDCVYGVKLLQPGFQPVSAEVVLAGADVPDLVFDPQAVEPPVPNVPGNPSGPDGMFFAITTSGGSGALAPTSELQYVLDATTFDVDRPPLGNVGGPGPEDTNAFLGVVDSPSPPAISTMSNAVGLNTRIDGPVGPNSVRVFVNIGMPIIGTSVQGDLRLAIGANP